MSSIPVEAPVPHAGAGAISLLSELAAMAEPSSAPLAPLQGVRAPSRGASPVAPGATATFSELPGLLKSRYAAVALTPLAAAVWTLVLVIMGRGL